MGWRLLDLLRRPPQRQLAGRIVPEPFDSCFSALQVAFAEACLFRFRLVVLLGSSPDKRDGP